MRPEELTGHVESHLRFDAPQPTRPACRHSRRRREDDCRVKPGNDGLSAGMPVIFGTDVVSILLGGLAAGMVLFIVSVGLSVTMGLMGFVNLAHGGFAMLGGYVIVLAMNRLGLGFCPGAGARLRRHRGGERRCSNGCSIAGSTGRPSSTRCCSPSASSSS